MVAHLWYFLIPTLITTFESSGQVLSYQKAWVLLVNAVSLVGTNRGFGMFVNRMGMGLDAGGLKIEAGECCM